MKCAFMALVFIIVSIKSIGLIKNEKNLIIIIEYKNKSYNIHKYKDVIILNEKYIDNFKNFDTSLIEGVMYFFTKNGAYCTEDDTLEISSLACCQYGNTENGYKLFLDSISNKDSDYIPNLKKTNLFNEIKTSKRRKFTIKRNSKKLRIDDIYAISIWSANIDYCVCKIFDSHITQPIFGNECAYIKKIEKISRVDYVTKNKIKKIIKNIIKLKT